MDERESWDALAGSGGDGFDGVVLRVLERANRLWRSEAAAVAPDVAAVVSAAAESCDGGELERLSEHRSWAVAAAVAANPVAPPRALRTVVERGLAVLGADCVMDAAALARDAGDMASVFSSAGVHLSCPSDVFDDLLVVDGEGFFGAGVRRLAALGDEVMGDVVPPAVDAAANSGEVAATEIAAVGAAALDVCAQLSRASVEMLVDSRAGMRAAHEMRAGSGDSDVRFDGVGAVAEARLCSDTEMLDRMARGGSWEVAAAMAANTATLAATLGYVGWWCLVAVSGESERLGAAAAGHSTAVVDTFEALAVNAAGRFIRS